MISCNDRGKLTNQGKIVKSKERFVNCQVIGTVIS